MPQVQKSPLKDSFLPEQGSNSGQSPEAVDSRKLDQDCCPCLVILRKRDGVWFIETGSSEVEEAFYGVVDEVGMDSLPEDYLFVFKICLSDNQDVRIFLLAAFHDEKGYRFDETFLDPLALWLRVERPKNGECQS